MRSQRAGERTLASVKHFLEKRLRLKVNEKKSAVDRTQRRQFLGYTISSGTKPKLWLSQKARARLRAKLRPFFRRARGRALDQSIADLNVILRGWMAYYRKVEAPTPLKTLSQWIRRKLRCIIWRQWKTERTRYRRLRALGMDSRDAYFQLTPRNPPSTYQRFGGWKTLAALAALTLAFLFGMSPPKKRGRTALLIVNVVVLGCLAGTFLTIGKLLAWLAHGVSLQNDLIPILMLALLVVAILIGRRTWYCAWVCPFGSLQELLARRIPWRWKPSPRRQKQLRLFRSGLWLLLLFAGWTLGMVDVFGYEPFGAFQWEHASAVVLGVAAMGIVLSLFLPRGYCRCLCPTGALLEFLESKETEK